MVVLPFISAVIVAVIIGLTVIFSGIVAFMLRRRRCQNSVANRSYTLSGFDRFDDAAGGEQEQLLDPICDNNINDNNNNP